MSTTRQQIRERVRGVIHDYPVTDILNGDHNASVTTIKVTTVSRYSLGQVLQIGSEVMRIEEVNSENSQLTVQRGYMYTTAAVHSSAAAISVFNKGGFTDSELNQFINNGIHWFVPEVYYIDTQLISSVSSTAVIVDISSYITNAPYGDRLLQIWWKLAGITPDAWKPFRDWTVQKDTLILERMFGATIDLKLIIKKYETVKTVDADTFNVDDEVLETLVLYVASETLRTLLVDRNKYTEYSALVEARAASPADFLNLVNSYERRAYGLKKQYYKVPPVTHMRRIMKF